MTTSDLVDALVASNGISKVEAKAIVATMFDAIIVGVGKGEVSLPGFGKFRVVDRPARKVRHPRTGETLIIAPTRRVSFIPSKALKAKVQR
jgi:DNA-binding protein HU-beta